MHAHVKRHVAKRDNSVVDVVYDTVDQPNGAPGNPPTAPLPACPGIVYVTVTAGGNTTMPRPSAPPAPPAGNPPPPPPANANPPPPPPPAANSNPPPAAAKTTPGPVPPPKPAATPPPPPPPPTTTPPPAAAPAPAPAPAAPAPPSPAPPAPKPASAKPTPAGVAAAASAPPAQSPSPVSAAASSGHGLRTKAGCLYIASSNTVCAALDDSAVSWATNWASTPNGGAASNVFIPQLWGTSSTYTSGWVANANAAIAAGATAVMGYNEPDLSSQASLSPSEGAASWHLVSQFSGRVTVVSPSVTSQDNNGDFTGIDWLSQFASAGASWDATGVHFYADCTDSPPNQVTYLQGIVNKAFSTFNKPVWVTEFGCNSGASTEQIASFLTTAVTYLEAEGNVHQYAAFQADLLVSGSSRNAAGNAYVAAASS